MGTTKAERGDKNKGKHSDTLIVIRCPLPFWPHLSRSKALNRIHAAVAPRVSIPSSGLSPELQTQRSEFTLSIVWGASFAPQTFHARQNPRPLFSTCSSPGLPSSPCGTTQLLRSAAETASPTALFLSLPHCSASTFPHAEPVSLVQATSSSSLGQDEW